MRSLAQATIVLALAAAGAGLSMRGGDAPAPAPHGAPVDAFSSERAMDVLGRILGDQRPHPLGSDANRVVRDRIVAEFGRIGLPASVRSRFACGATACARVDNVLARLPGASGDGARLDDAILLTAHYDSVAAGPGAGDDGAGVAAVVEAARALKAGPPLPRDVWFLLDDGEEAGLLGAHAFAQEPEFGRIGWVVNLEARGDVGASSLIETQAGNAGVVAAIGRALPRPSGTSLDYEIYKTLPNDTDFTVYRAHGLGGANFALSRGAARYHTPRDDIAHLSPGSLQHHGDNAVALVREFANTPALRLRAEGDMVFVHPFAAFPLAWPATWNLPLLALAGLAWLLLAWRLRAAGMLGWRSLAFAGTVATLGWLLLLLPAWLLSWALSALGATPAPWTAQGGWLSAAFAALGLGVAWMLAAPLQRRWGEVALALATPVPFLLLAAAAVAWMPGASFMGLLPILVAGLAGQWRPARTLWWSGAAAVAAAVLWTPYALDIYPAIGRDGLASATLLSGVVGLALMPAIAALGRGGRWLAAFAIAASLACAAVASSRPAFDAGTPRPLNLLLAGEDGRPARLLASPLATPPAAFLAGNGFAAVAERALPFGTRPYHAGPQGDALSAPSLAVLADETRGDRRRLRLRVRPVQAGDELVLHLPGSVDKASVRVEGMPLADSRRPWRHVVSYVDAPDEGVLFEFEAASGEPLRLVLVGETRGLPAAFDRIVHARDAVATPIHGGDRTVAWREATLAPAPAP